MRIQNLLLSIVVLLVFCLILGNSLVGKGNKMLDEVDVDELGEFNIEDNKLVTEGFIYNYNKETDVVMKENISEEDISDEDKRYVVFDKESMYILDKEKDVKDEEERLLLSLDHENWMNILGISKVDKQSFNEWLDSEERRSDVGGVANKTILLMFIISNVIVLLFSFILFIMKIILGINMKWKHGYYYIMIALMKVLPIVIVIYFMDVLFLLYVVVLYVTFEISLKIVLKHKVKSNSILNLIFKDKKETNTFYRRLFIEEDNKNSKEEKGKENEISEIDEQKDNEKKKKEDEELNKIIKEHKEKYKK